MTAPIVAQLAAGGAEIDIVRWGASFSATATWGSGGASVGTFPDALAAMQAAVAWLQHHGFVPVKGPRITFSGECVAVLGSDPEIGDCDLVQWSGVRATYEAQLTTPDGDRVVTLAAGQDRASVERRGREVFAGMVETKRRRAAALAAGAIVELRPRAASAPIGGGDAA